MKRLSNGTLRMKPRSGQSADVNSTETKATALGGELHYCEDTGDLYYYNAVTDVMLKLAVVS
jgi:hypothetical protein